MATYLDFEEPLKELEEQIVQTREIGENTNVDILDSLLGKKFNFRVTPIARIRLLTSMALLAEISKNCTATEVLKMTKQWLVVLD
jgi:hypothetical protein